MAPPEKIALIADIHGNLPALASVLRDIRQVGCSRLFVLGDIIPGLDPVGCVELLQSWDHVECLKGNAEFYLLTPDLQDFPLRHEPFYADLIEHLGWIRARLSSAHIDWLHRLPDIIYWNGACLVHDSPFDRLFPQQRHVPKVDAKYQELFYHAPGIKPHMPADEIAKLVAFMNERHLSQIFCAHTHMPFVHHVDSKIICNVGSVGLPLDGDTRAAWALVESDENNILSVKIRRVEYDTNQILEIADANPDFPTFQQLDMRTAYRAMLTTGIHWREHLQKNTHEAHV